MTSGLTVVGTHGTFQIDNVNLNLNLRQKGSVATLSGGSLYLLSKVTLRLNATYPIIATVCAFGVATQTIRVSPGVWDVTFVCNGPAGTAINWYLFDSIPAQEGNFGLVLWDQNGRIIFSSNHLTYRVIDRYSSSNYSNFPARVSLPAGKSYAVSSFRWAGGSERISSPENSGYLVEDTTWTFLANVNGNTLELGEAEDYYNAFVVGGGQAPITWHYERKAADVIVIDVTNY